MVKVLNVDAQYCHRTDQNLAAACRFTFTKLCRLTDHCDSRKQFSKVVVLWSEFIASVPVGTALPEMADFTIRNQCNALDAMISRCPFVVKLAQMLDQETTRVAVAEAADSETTQASLVSKETLNSLMASVFDPTAGEIQKLRARWWMRGITPTAVLKDDLTHAEQRVVTPFIANAPVVLVTDDKSGGQMRLHTSLTHRPSNDSVAIISVNKPIGGLAQDVVAIGRLRIPEQVRPRTVRGLTTHENSRVPKWQASFPRSGNSGIGASSTDWMPFSPILRAEYQPCMLIATRTVHS